MNTDRMLQIANPNNSSVQMSKFQQKLTDLVIVLIKKASDWIMLLHNIVGF